MLDDADKAEIADIARSAILRVLADAPDVQGLAVRVSLLHEEIRNVRSMANDYYAMTSHAFELLSQKLEEHDARFDRLEVRIEGLEVRLDRVEVRLAGLEARIDGLEARVETIETRLDDLDGRLTGIQTRLDDLDGRLTGIQTRMDGLEGGMESLETRLTGMEGRMNGLEGHVGQLASSFEEFAAESRESFHQILERLPEAS